MRYTPSTGGHAPGHLRDFFAEWIEHGEIDRGNYYGMPERAFVDPEQWITGQLWNCADILPSDLCAVLDLPSGSTYTVASRGRRGHIVGTTFLRTYLKRPERDSLRTD